MLFRWHFLSLVLLEQERERGDWPRAQMVVRLFWKGICFCVWWKQMGQGASLYFCIIMKFGCGSLFHTRVVDCECSLMRVGMTRLPQQGLSVGVGVQGERRGHVLISSSWLECCKYLLHCWWYWGSAVFHAFIKLQTVPSRPIIWYQIQLNLREFSCCLHLFWCSLTSLPKGLMLGWDGMGMLHRELRAAEDSTATPRNLSSQSNCLGCASLSLGLLIWVDWG